MQLTRTKASDQDLLFRRMAMEAVDFGSNSQRRIAGLSCLLDNCCMISRYRPT
jgi:hypothetical protein